MTAANEHPQLPAHETADRSRERDLVVLGTGAAGLSAALVGANEGLDCLVLEKTDFLGGTTAYSAGTCWIPNNRFQREGGVTDDAAAATRYLDELIGDRSPRELRQAYLEHAPKMIDYMHDIGVRFWPSTTVVDYHPDLPGAGMGGRALEPVPFDGRTLDKYDFSRIRRPIPEFALFGGNLMVRRAEVNTLLKIYGGSSARPSRPSNSACGGPPIAPGTRGAPGSSWATPWWRPCLTDYCSAGALFGSTLAPPEF